MIVPEGIVSTGWPAVRDTCRSLGVGFDGWQEGATQLILSKTADGMYATTVGGVTMSIPRQVGKTYLIGWVVFALCIIHPGLTVIWTAHLSATASETFGDMKSMAGRPKVAPHIERTPDNGEETAVIFTNGSRIVFGARERGFGRGFKMIDVVVFDEAQILKERAIDDMVPAQNASPNALTIMIGTPPRPIDPSEAFEEARRAALSGDAPDSLYIEFSADENGGLDDRAQWRKANPSYPARTNESSMLRMRRKLSDDSFGREALGRWDKAGTGKDALNRDSWNDLAIESPDPDWPAACYAVDMSNDRSKVSIGIAEFADGTGLHLELVADAPFSEEGVSAVVDWLWERCKRRIPVIIDGYSPAKGVLEVPLKAKKMKVFILGPQEYLQACAMLTNAVEKEKSVSHFGQETLDDSVAGTIQVPVKNKPGVFSWTYKDLESDISPLRCISGAHYGALKFAKRRTSGVSKKRYAVVG